MPHLRIVGRIALISALALAVSATAWLVGGNAWATHREEQCDPAWTTEFGSLDDLKKKYPKRETNETAKRLEILAKDLGLDLAPAVRTPGSVPHRLTPADEKSGQAVNDYISAQISKPEASIDALPEEISRFFEEKRVGLDAIELLLVAGPSPQWSFDLSESDRLPNGLGQIRLQRVLMARALTAASGGRSEAAARSLEASWNLNESLRGRPETIPALLSIAIARLQVGTLRKVSVEEDRWRKRLAGLDPRAALLDALVLEYRPASARCFWKHASTVGDPPSLYQRSRNFLMSPTDRLVMTDVSNLMRDELMKLQAAPLTDHFSEVPNSNVRDAGHVILAISMPNIHNSFLRADRLVIDAELTSKILEAKQLRRENRGRWPAAIPGIESSRYPAASWRYEVSPDGGRMSIAFSRELASPYGGPLKALPLLFSSN